MDKNYGYKHTKGFIAFVLLVMIMAITAAYAQTSPNTPSGYSIDNQTGNLIANGGITSATGWTVTTGSPTWTPVSPGGVFDADGYTYSYGRESLGQAGISLGSFNHGYLNSGAVFVTGFSYGLTYRFPCANSIGTNCDGTSQTAAPANPVQDNLRVEVGYYPSTGNPTFYTHQLGLKNINDGNPAYNPNWQTLAETVTFAGAKPLAQAGSVNFEIIGNDAGNWACLSGTCYGPQVKNAYIRANYSVDPCILNPAFNPNCPGFNTVIQGWQSPTYWNSYNIATTLPHIGGGVQLHGFDYGFNWTNYGSCYASFLFWCTDWRTDGGGYVNFRVSDKNNTTLYSDRQYRQGDSMSGSYSNRFLFTETRNSLDLGSVQWYTDSVWNNFWVAGWTRPIWTPDPCYFNGLYSPNCSNFQATLTQVMADLKAQQEKISAQNASVSSSTPAPGGTITTTVIADATNPSVTVTTEQIQIQPKSNTEEKTNNLSIALNLVRTNERREQSIATQTSQQAISAAASVAQQSQQQAESVAEQNKEQGLAASLAAEAAARELAQNSIPVDSNRNSSNATIFALPSPVREAGPRIGPSNTTLTQSQQNSFTLPEQTINSSVNTEIVTPQQNLPIQVALPSSLPVQQSTQFVSQQVDVSQQLTFPVVQPVATQQLSLPEPTQPAPMLQANTQIPTQVVNLQPQVVEQSIQPIQVAIAQPTFDIRSLEQDTATSQTNFITNRTNPITEIVEGKQSLNDSNKQETRTDTVNKSAQNNELAGGVDIASIAITPQGFNVYASLVLRDAAFYAPKEIYKGQRTVDNIRALRNLSSDRLHQDMIDLQYRR